MKLVYKLHTKNEELVKRISTSEVTILETMNVQCICLVNELMDAKGMVFRTGVDKQLNSKSTVFRIGGTNFLHCWVTNSIIIVRTY